METVQLQCGNCKKLMAISAEHLGAQVQCPHCRSVVQTVKRAPEPPPAPVAKEEPPPRESIFAGSESSDSMMGDVPAPKVELPSVDSNSDAGESASAPTLEPAATPSTESTPQADFAQFKRRPVYEKSVLLLIALIFLVPYAFVMTLFVIYLVLFRPAAVDPLEYLRDPVPSEKKGAPKRAFLQPVQDTPIAQHRRTTLGQPVQVGDLVITPQRVMLTADKDLRLVLRAKNVSTNTRFDPINEAYVKYPAKEPDKKPFTFLESRSKSVENLYGAYLGYHKDRLAKDVEAGEAVLAPGEEITIALTTYQIYRDKHIPNITSGDDTFLWRVRVRRGFVKVDGRDVSATTVIGVEFSSKDIEKS